MYADLYSDGASEGGMVPEPSEDSHRTHAVPALGAAARLCWAFYGDMPGRRALLGLRGHANVPAQSTGAPSTSAGDGWQGLLSD